MDAEERLEGGEQKGGREAGGGGRDRTATEVLGAFAYLTYPSPG